jgi:putative ABC transport system ATP-binding protein
MTEDERAKLRGQKVGFVFQSFQLIPTLNALENVQVPLELRGDSAHLASHGAASARRTRRPARSPAIAAVLVVSSNASAIARAFSNRPGILFADEPTGNLDGANGALDRRVARGAESRVGDDHRPGDA